MAQSMLGKQEYIGWCQSFVEKMGGTTSGASAIQAWQNAQNKVTGTQGIQPGDLVYFSANQGNQNNGHTGIYQGNGQFVSATDNGIATHDLSGWQSGTGQKLLGYVPQGARQPQVQQGGAMGNSQQTQPQQRQVIPPAPIMQVPQTQAPQAPQINPMEQVQKITGQSPLSGQNPLSSVNPLQQ